LNIFYNLEVYAFCFIPKTEESAKKRFAF
jgi:hypothetical protein